MTNIEARRNTDPTPGGVGSCNSGTPRRVPAHARARYQFENGRVPLYLMLRPTFWPNSWRNALLSRAPTRGNWIHPPLHVYIGERVRSLESNFPSSDWKLRGCVLSRGNFLLHLLPTPLNRKRTVSCVAIRRQQRRDFETNRCRDTEIERYIYIYIYFFFFFNYDN